MNIKGILRSSAAKLIAFAGIVGCFAGALFLTENTITDFAVDNGSNMVYRFEGFFIQLLNCHRSTVNGPPFLLPTRTTCVSSSA